MGSPLRVLQLIDSLAPSGAERSLAMMAPRLVAAGVDVHVAYLIEREGLREELEKDGIAVHSLANGSPSRRRWLARASYLIAELQPAVVHSTLFEADLAGRRAAARQRVPSISSLVNTAYGPTESSREGLRRVKTRAAHAVDALTARRVTRFHAVTQHVATVMGRRLRIPQSKIEVIPRGRDAAALGRRTPERRAAARRRLGIGDDATMILAIGRQEPQKGFDTLIRAFPAVRARFPDAILFVAGREGSATPQLMESIQEFGSAGRVRLLGRRTDVPDLLAAADVFAFPSRWEGAAGTVLEAMALECPIVSSRLPTIMESVDDSTAETVVPDDTGDLARGLLATLSDRDTAARRASAARQRFEQEFTIQASAHRMAQLYSRVTTSG